MNKIFQETKTKRDKKTLDSITQKLVEQEKEDNKSLQKVSLMSYLSS